MKYTTGNKPSKFCVLKTKISAIDMKDACSLVEDRISRKDKGYICVCPISTIMECKKSEDVLKSVNCADLVTPDGMPVVWIGRMKGHKNIRRVYGPDLMREICGISERKGYKNYFYGSTEDVLKKLEESLNKKYPRLAITGSYSPPFRVLSKEENDRIVENINKSNPDILWVGLGSPKQDLWMYQNRGKINAPVMLGVGAAFDFLSGVKPQAPRWMQNSGLEWLFRLATEPSRLWRRYLISYPLFIYYLLIDTFSKKERIG